MTPGLEISLAPERLDEGSPEEKATFGLLAIRAGNLTLTEGFDSFIDALRPGPLVSGYHAAEWFAWNWWRLRYEPDSRHSADWWRAHQMNAIGEGYIWPNITFRTDGVRATLISSPSANPDAKPFRFVGAQPWVGPVTLLEEAIDAFIPRILARLTHQGLPETNLQRTWSEVLEERRDPEVAERRRLEALLGHDADEVDDSAIQSLLDDAKQLGTAAVNELAADARGQRASRASTLRNIAAAEGFAARLDDAVRLSANDLQQVCGQAVAWRQGHQAAQALRRDQRLGTDPVSTARLSQLLGTAAPGQHKGYAMSPLSFLLHGDHGTAHIVLRSKWKTGKRFELARLLGDYLIFGTDAPMLPATRAYTFRQKVQRAFAAEFLSPFDAVENMLQGDFSPEAIEEVAEYFAVSTLTVETLLRNHGLIEREPLADVA